MVCLSHLVVDGGSEHVGCVDDSGGVLVGVEQAGTHRVLGHALQRPAVPARVARAAVFGGRRERGAGEGGRGMEVISTVVFGCKPIYISDHSSCWLQRGGRWWVEEREVGGRWEEGRKVVGGAYRCRCCWTRTRPEGEERRGGGGARHQGQ